MSHRQKNKHKSRHRVHEIKPVRLPNMLARVVKDAPTDANDFWKKRKDASEEASAAGETPAS